MENLFKAIQIQTLTGCNRSCKFCANSQVSSSFGEEMPDHIFDSIVQQLKKLKYAGRISPYLMNEPLLDKALEYKIQKIKKAIPKAHIRINTNGDLLGTKRFISLFNSGMDGIIIDCYDSTKQFNAMLNLVKSGIKSVPDVILQPKFNIRKTPIKKRFAQVYDCSNYEKDSPYLTNYAGHVQRDIGIKLPLKRSCFTVFEQMFVNHKGDSVLCCQDWAFQVILGNVAKDGLLAIWQGKILEDYRNKLSQADRSQLVLCNNCDSRNEKDMKYRVEK